MGKLVSFSNSTVSVVGSVTLELRKYIMSLFPENFFKKVYIEGTLSENSMANTDEFIKSENPKLGIGYTFDLDKSNNYGHYSMHTYGDGDRTMYNKFLPVIFENKNDDIILRASLTRFKINFDIRMSANTNIQLNNIYHWLQTRLTTGDKKYLKAPINCKINNDIIKVIQLAKDFKTYEELNEYLMDNKMMIQKIRDSSAGKDIYVMAFESNLLFEFNGIDKEKTDKNGKVENQGTVRLSIDISASMPSVFYLDVKSSKADTIEPEPADLNSLMTPLFLKYTKFRPPEMIENLERFAFEYYVSSDTDEPDDILDLKDVFIEEGYESTLDLITTFKDYTNFNEIFKIKVYRDEKLLPDDEYYIDTRDFTLVTKDAYKNYSHVFGLYVDKLKLNKYVKEKLPMKKDFLEMYK